MTSIPYGIVRARRTTGVLLLVASLATVVALAVAIGTWLTAAPTVRPISLPAAGSTVVTPAVLSSVPGTAPASPHDQLVQERIDDAPAVTGIPDGYWVPQLASNRPGTDQQGHVWDEAGILQDHLSKRQYGGVLLWSGDFQTFKSKDYWVTVVASQASSTPEPVLAWCANSGFNGDQCYAKRISVSDPYTGNNTMHPQ